MEPLVSVPIPMKAKPAETLTALPVDEPPGLFLQCQRSKNKTAIFLTHGERSPSSSTGSPYT